MLSWTGLENTGKETCLRERKMRALAGDVCSASTVRNKHLG